MVIPGPLAAFGSANTDRIEAALGLDPADLRAFSTERFLFLCFTNRCGSTYLAHLLHRTGRLAYPDEYFLADAVIARARVRSLRSLQHYVSELPVEHGWIAAKLGLAQLLMLARTGILAEITARSAFILIERQDKIAQAISRVFAFESDVWAYDHPGNERHMPPYARAAIDRQRAVIEQETYGFYCFFAANRITPLHLSYEMAVAAPHQAIDRVSDHLGLTPLQARPQAIASRAQSGAQNALWRALYAAGR